MTINAVLRRLRESKGFSQQNVADELDVNVTSIGRWETNGEAIKSSVLKKLAAIYNVKLSDLYTYEQEPSNETDSPTLPPHPIAIYTIHLLYHDTPQHRSAIYASASHRHGRKKNIHTRH